MKMTYIALGLFLVMAWAAIRTDNPTLNRGNIAQAVASGIEASGIEKPRQDTSNPPAAEPTVSEPAVAEPAAAESKVVETKGDDSPVAEDKVAQDQAPAEAGQAPASSVAVQPEPPDANDLEWITDYAEAVRSAKAQEKMLLIFFHQGENDPIRRDFEDKTLADPAIRQMLPLFVLAKLPVDREIVEEGKISPLLKHPAFMEMLGKQGVAIIDYAHEKKDFYGYVVSTFPFSKGKYHDSRAMSVILGLPPGTLTQRTMIFAVRNHPEAPESTKGELNPVLREEAKSHSSYQASITLQGHHSWDARFQRINAQMPQGVVAQEVVAESWPNENLVEACEDCVHSWRQSPGHWGAVRSRPLLFGYDIERGRNGIWYATGIFGRR